MNTKSIIFLCIILITLFVGIYFLYPFFQDSKPQFFRFKGSADSVYFIGQNSNIQFKTTAIYFNTNETIFSGAKNITIESNKGELKFNDSFPLEIFYNENMSQALFNNIDAEIFFENLTMTKVIGANNIDLDGYTSNVKLKPNGKEVIIIQSPYVKDVSMGGQKLVDFYSISFEIDNTSSIRFIPGKFKSQVYNVSDLKIESFLLSKITVFQGEGVLGLKNHNFDVNNADQVDIESLSNYQDQLSFLSIADTKIIFVGYTNSAKINKEELIMSEVSYWLKKQPEALFSGINAFAVVILAVVTIWYAYSTKSLLNEQTKSRKIAAIEKKLEHVYSPINNSLVEFNDRLQPFPRNEIPNIYDRAFKELHSELLEINRNYNHLLDEDIRTYYREVYNSWLKYSSDTNLTNYNSLQSLIYKFHKLTESKIKEATKLLANLQN